MLRVLCGAFKDVPGFCRLAKRWLQLAKLTQRSDSWVGMKSKIVATATLGVPPKRRPLDFLVGNYRKEKIATLLRKHGAKTGDK
jgi:hypothetical protein